MAKVIYENPLATQADLEELIQEGKRDISFTHEGVSILSQSEDDGAGLWCPKAFPADIKIEWEFRPLEGDGCAAVSFAVKDENAFHVIYFRRINDEDKSFHVCSLIKDVGSQVVAVGADPMPDVPICVTDEPENAHDENAELPWYRMAVLKKGKDVAFWINDLEVLSFHDDGMAYGDLLTGGNVGLRQAGDFKAEYRNLKVTWV